MPGIGINRRRRGGPISSAAAVPVPDEVSGIAEEIVHDAFAAMHREWRRLRDADRAVAYLRRTIVRRIRDRAPRPWRMPSIDHTPPATLAGQDTGMSGLSARVLAALRRLPGRQREALVLRYYADLPEAQAAHAMGVSRTAFRGHARQGMTALRLHLAQCLSTVLPSMGRVIHSSMHRIHNATHAACTVLSTS